MKNENMDIPSVRNRKKTRMKRYEAYLRNIYLRVTKDIYDIYGKTNRLINGEHTETPHFSSSYR